MTRYVMNIFVIATVHLALVQSNACVLKKRPDPSRGGELTWSLPRSELCYCQVVVAAQFASACARNDDYKDLWFVTDKRLTYQPILSRKLQKDILDDLLQRTEYCADECATDFNNCDENAVCYDILGGFTCVCKTGYDGDGVTCTDINECTAHTDNCHDNAECSNIIGSFNCTCNEGYTGNGLSCAAPVCNDYMGVANGDIPNANMQASSVLSNFYAAYKGRLNRNSFWATLTDYVIKPWIQADIGYQTFVSGVITQGDGESGLGADWVTSFKVSTFISSNSGSNSTENFVMNDNQVMIFPGNDDETSVKTFYFPEPVFAQIVRITCLSKQNFYNNMRFEILGCKNN